MPVARLPDPASARRDTSFLLLPRLLLTLLQLPVLLLPPPPPLLPLVLPALVLHALPHSLLPLPTCPSSRSCFGDPKHEAPGLLPSSEAQSSEMSPHATSPHPAAAPAPPPPPPLGVPSGASPPCALSCAFRAPAHPARLPWSCVRAWLQPRPHPCGDTGRVGCAGAKRSGGGGGGGGEAGSSGRGECGEGSASARRLAGRRSAATMLALAVCA